MHKNLVFFLSFLLLLSCGNDEKSISKEEAPIPEPKPRIEYGYNLDNYVVINDTVKKGEAFSQILDRNHVPYPKVLEIANKIKDTFDVRRLKAGTPYTILATKDSLEMAQVFIYKRSKVRYTVVEFKDSIIEARNERRPVTSKWRTASGIISTNLSEAMDEQGHNAYLTYKMADDIYAWTIDFSRLQKGDKFKLVYEELYLNDTIPVGIGDVRSAYFEHGGKPHYAFRFLADSIIGQHDFFDENAVNLRRQFLKMPVKFGYLSSRYNLKRRIAYYGNKVRPHKGTDFAAPVGTPIMSTANGRVVESRYKGGNGNYVKVRHNATYSTQYLHMSKRAVKVGDVVKQGDVIGYIGMTGNTSGPHVCYRFWKNGRQVDPLREKLPAAEPMKETIKPSYFEYIEDLKTEIDAVQYPTVESADEIAFQSE